jgi:hypothetical protein
VTAPELWWSISQAERANVDFPGLIYRVVDGEYVTPPHLPADAVRLVPESAWSAQRAAVLALADELDRNAPARPAAPDLAARLREAMGVGQ